MNPVDAAPYDALGTLAAFSAAISIAYAGLPNFRHRELIQQYVRDKVKTNALADVLATNAGLKDQESWCVLYRLGNLKEASAPKPRTEADKNFQRWTAFKAFNWLYGTNLDKLITIALGSLSASVIWFGLVDRTHFPVPKIPDYHREWLLSTFVGFYAVFILAGIGSLILHSVIFSKPLQPEKWYHSIPYWVNFTIVGVFVFLVVLSDFGIHPLGDLGRWLLDFVTDGPIGMPIETAVFAISRTILLLAALAPLYLLWRGSQLTKSMTAEVDRCVQVLGANAVDAAKGAVINPAE